MFSINRKLLVICSLVIFRSVIWIKLRNSKIVYKQLFSKKRIILYIKQRSCRLDNKLKGAMTLKIKHGVQFVGRLKTIKHIIAISLLPTFLPEFLAWSSKPGLLTSHLTGDLTFWSLTSLSDFLPHNISLCLLTL